MNRLLRSHADQIVRSAIDAVTPDRAVRRLLTDCPPAGRVILIAAGKAAWKMARTAVDCLPGPVHGIVITKYGHAGPPLEGIQCFEAGHPMPDENGIAATRAVLAQTRGLTRDDTVLFLLSGGASALFELPLIPLEELRDITAQLLACGADIVEINTLRKRLSAVKGGRFAQWCAPAKVMNVVLSDVLGDRLDMIASGPAAADPSTCAEALQIVKKYGLSLSGHALSLLDQETPKALDNAHAHVIGSVRELVRAAEEACRELGYEPVYLTDRLDCEAREAGRFLAAIARSHSGCGRRLAFLAGGETVVHLTGTGRGGRNQELALAAAEGLSGLTDAAVFSVGSDGTDGPTDAAGGYADGDTLGALRDQGLDPGEILARSDSYHGLKAVGGLIVTGPTGTNVNDISVALVGTCDGERSGL